MKRISWVALALLALCVTTGARMPASLVSQVESSMVVTGTIDIAADGSTERLAIDEPDKLPDGVLKLLETSGARWRFEPAQVDGRPTRVRSRMSVRVIARKVGDDAYEVELRGASFAPSADDPGTLRKESMTPPQYPRDAFARGYQGNVYLIARIARDGRVEDVVAEQVNLTVYGKPREMEAAREMLAKASLRAARDWRFHPPTAGDEVDAPYWLVRIPVSYEIGDATRRRSNYGQWEAYLPGPRTPAPWPDATRGIGSDAMVAGEVQTVGAGPRLVTPLEG